MTQIPHFNLPAPNIWIEGGSTGHWLHIELDEAMLESVPAFGHSSITFIVRVDGVEAIRITRRNLPALVYDLQLLHLAPRTQPYQITVVSTVEGANTAPSGTWINSPPSNGSDFLVQGQSGVDPHMPQLPAPIIWVEDGHMLHIELGGTMLTGVPAGQQQHISYYFVVNGSRVMPIISRGDNITRVFDLREITSPVLPNGTHQIQVISSFIGTNLVNSWQDSQPSNSYDFTITNAGQGSQQLPAPVLRPNNGVLSWEPVTHNITSNVGYVNLDYSFRINDESLWAIGFSETSYDLLNLPADNDLAYYGFFRPGGTYTIQVWASVRVTELPTGGDVFREYESALSNAVTITILTEDGQPGITMPQFPAPTLAISENGANFVINLALLSPLETPVSFGYILNGEMTNIRSQSTVPVRRIKNSLGIDLIPGTHDIQVVALGGEGEAHRNWRTSQPSNVVTVTTGQEQQNMAAPNLNAASTWAHEHIQSAFEKGFIPAEMQSNYTQVTTRLEFARMAVMFIEYASSQSIDEFLLSRGLSRNPNAFNDTSDPYILAAFALGITTGTGANQFTPQGQLTREQAATMLQRVWNVLGLDTVPVTAAGFSDIGNASAWAIDGINFAFTHGIMSGVGNNMFNPSGLYTREQSIVTFDRIQ